MIYLVYLYIYISISSISIQCIVYIGTLHGYIKIPIATHIFDAIADILLILNINSRDDARHMKTLKDLMVENKDDESKIFFLKVI